MNSFSRQIQEKIKAIKNEDKARWLENYVKHDIKSLGVGIPKIREVIKETDEKNRISAKPFAEQKEMLDDLMKQAYTEHKLAAILFVQLYLKNNASTELLEMISSWFDHKWISDWDVCDWLCVRILSPLVDKDSKEIFEALERWNKDENLWKARASLVPFAQCKTIGDHWETIYRFSDVLIKREERFCKTAVGWVLRQYSKIDSELVLSFLKDYENWTTNEVIKNATKYLKK